MEKTYWLARVSRSQKAAHDAISSEARMIHLELAGRYSVQAAGASEAKPAGKTRS